MVCITSPVVAGTGLPPSLQAALTSLIMDFGARKRSSPVDTIPAKLLASCAAIRECMVCERNQRICAVVCCDPDQQDAVRDFVTKVNRTLPLYKHMVVEFSAQPLPRNAAGKLLRS